MNSRIHRLSVLILTLQTLSSAAFAMPSLKVEQLVDGKFRIVGCGFQANESFKLRYGSNGIDSDRRTNKDGCVSEMLTAMMSSTNEIVITYKNEKKSVPVVRESTASETQKKTQSTTTATSGGYARPGSGSGGTQASQPEAPKTSVNQANGYTRPGTDGKPGPAQSSGSTSTAASAAAPAAGTQAPKPAPVQLKSVSEAQLKENAQRAAQQFFERVLKVYGSIERARLGVRAGLDDANSNFEKFNGDITKTAAFKEAIQRLQDRGTSDGTGFGMQKAEEQGTRQGAREADRRFTQAAEENRGSAPDLTFSAITPTLTELKVEPKTEKVDMRTRVQGQDQELQNEIRELLVEANVPAIQGTNLVEKHFSLGHIWARSYEPYLGQAFLNGSNGYSYWASGNQTGLVPDKELLQWMEMVSDSSAYASARAGVSNRELFRSFFIEAYLKQAARWEGFVKESNGRIAEGSREVGKKLFDKILVDQAKSLGEAIGYTRSFNKAATQSFAGAFESFARMGFDRIVSDYQKKAVLTNVEMQLANSSARDLAPGDKLNLIVKNALNKGMKASESQARVSGDGLTVSGDAPVVRIDALSRVAEDKPLVVEGFAQVASNVLLNKPFNAEVALGNLTLKVQLTATMKGSVAKVAELGKAGAPEAAQAIVQTLKKEWEENRGGIDTIYDNGDTMLDELVKAVTALDAQKQQAFGKELHSEIRKIYLETRPGFWSSERDDYDSTKVLFEKMGWAF